MREITKIQKFTHNSFLFTHFLCLFAPYIENAPVVWGRTSKSLKAFCYRLKAQFYNLVIIITYNNSAYRTILFLLIAVRISAFLLSVSYLYYSIFFRFFQSILPHKRKVNSLAVNYLPLLIFDIIRYIHNRNAGLREF